MNANVSFLAALGNHLWQSTVCVGVIWLLVIALKKNRSAVRYWLWFAASVKFLIPLSALVALSSRLSWRNVATAVQAQWSFILDNTVEPFTPPVSALHAVSSHTAFGFAPVVIAVWLCGVAVGVVVWLRCWTRMRRVRSKATPLPFGLPIPVLSSASQIEPGVFGIFRPVLLLPHGIESRLTPSQLDAILAHEMAHVRRRDNLTAVIHMVVETMFWFHPLVWWIRAALVEERELACDEEVLLRGGEPEVYAEGIVEICKSYVESPAACVSGISGADLKQRIVRIVNRRMGENLSPGRRLLLSAIAIAAVAGPLGFGLLSAPRLRGQSSQAASAPLPSFDVVSVKANRSGVRGGTIDAHAGRLTITNIPLRMCMRVAFHLQNYQLLGGPGWPASERFDIIATTDAPATDEQLMSMLQSVLAERFKLALHRETREMEESALVVSKDGPKLKRVEPAGNDWVRTGVGRITGQEVSMSLLANTLAQKLGHPVADETGLSGVFDITLEWTPDSATPVNPAENKEAPPVESTSDSSGPSIFTALQEQLGLRLVPRKGPVDVYVIDHVEEPTPN